MLAVVPRCEHSVGVHVHTRDTDLVHVEGVENVATKTGSSSNRSPGE